MVCIFLALTSCNSKLTYKQAIHRSYGKTIDLSWNKLQFQKDTLVSYPLLPDVPIKIVSYIDKSLCDQCLVKYLWGVEKLMQKFDSNSIRFIVILASRPEEQVLNTLKGFNSISCDIILDVDDLFVPYNRLERYPDLCRVFLVDEDNRIILTGDPLRHTDLQKLYIEKINELISKGNLL